MWKILWYVKLSCMSCSAGLQNYENVCSVYLPSFPLKIKIVKALISFPSKSEILNVQHFPHSVLSWDSKDLSYVLTLVCHIFYSASNSEYTLSLFIQ